MEDEPEIEFKAVVTHHKNGHIVEISEIEPSGDYTIAGFIALKAEQAMRFGDMSTKISIEITPVLVED